MTSEEMKNAGTCLLYTSALLLDREQADYEKKENAGQFTAPARHAAVKTIGFLKARIKEAEAGEREGLVPEEIFTGAAGYFGQESAKRENMVLETCLLYTSEWALAL